MEMVDPTAGAPAGQAEGAETDPDREEFNRRMVELLADFLTRLAELEAQLAPRGTGSRED
jgi:hypothetical protein